MEEFKSILKHTQLLTSAHAQLAQSLSSLGNVDGFSSGAKAHLRHDRPALLALKKLCQQAPKLAEQQVKFSEVMQKFDNATSNIQADEAQPKQNLYSSEEMKQGVARAGTPDISSSI